MRFDLSVLDNSNDSYARSIFIYEGDIYIAGYTEDGQGKKQPCYWRNEERNELSTLTENEGTAQSISVVDGVVYICGRTNNESNIKIPCYWINGLRTDLGPGESATDGIAMSITVY